MTARRANALQADQPDSGRNDAVPQAAVAAPPEEDDHRECGRRLQGDRARVPSPIAPAAKPVYGLAPATANTTVATAAIPETVRLPTCGL